MNEPDTRYARVDGHRIAYQITGEGPIDLVFCSGVASIDAEWDEPEIAHFNRRMGEYCRVIRFDDLGSGASDPLPPSTGVMDDLQAAQILAVMDAANSERAILAGGDSGSPGILIVAARHPDRVAGLLLLHAVARVIPDDDYPFGMPLAELEMWESLYDQMDVDQILKMTIPSRADDEQFMRWGRKWLRGLAAPATSQRMIQQAKEMDLRALLPEIQSPASVLHRVDYEGYPKELSQYLADHLPNGRFIEIPGTDGPPWFDHPEVFLEVLRDMAHEVGGEAPTRRRTERVMASVLFTDLVDSTQLAQRQGDAEWRNLLELHDDLSRRCVKDAGGTLVKSTGDGILATFDSPGSAIHCAVNLSTSLGRLHLPIRAGVHTGEIEILGADIGGVAVHIAARVMAAAGSGEILVSRTVHDLVTGSGFTFVDRGAHPLKGVDGEWQLYELQG